MHHPAISVGVYSRQRKDILKNFVNSYIETTRKQTHYPLLTILHDAPDKLYDDDAVEEMDKYAFSYDAIRNVVLPDKSGLTRLLNQCIILAPTDWVLLCNDDMTFNPGWVEYLEQTIATGKYDGIFLFHYGGICFHKSLILKIGWFDERFMYGGFEDNDYQLRVAEAGIKERFDFSHDFIRRDGGVEVGHYMNHLKYVYNTGGWAGDNSVWFRKKWSTEFTAVGPNWSKPSSRLYSEIDWYPFHTKTYFEKFKILPSWPENNKLSIASQRGFIQ